ncbi:EAL domain-containing protein [Legionella waltersii]|uniref:Sensory box protein n=1 Tax=Legionella waltersii TaxID=66969 RepID=A0A0W1AMH0_9GAMM|nr:EAL domain-containing protein [Legionella waltersii]KTD82527.1 sensory box protein [Legionella waltersii]SNV03063.1 sensory box protein [Legionella waltersii]
MNNSFLLNETTLRRVPHFLVLIIILLLGLPYLGINWGLDFGNVKNIISPKSATNTLLFESQIRGYFRQSLLQWSGFSLAAVTVLLAFTQFRLSNNKIALIIGLSVLFSGSVEALHSLTIDSLSLTYNEKNNLDALVWIFANSISGLILIIGLVLMMNSKSDQTLNLGTFILLTIFLVLTAVTLIYYAAGVIELPQMLFQDAYLSRPYELISIFIYLIVMIIIYPKTYTFHPNILSDCIFYMALTQVVLSIYIMLLSNTPYDSAFNIAYFLKVLAYFIPCTCFVINYVLSYSAVLNAQKKLKIKQDELQYIASHDSLTNLFNRREFEELLDKSIANALRNSSSLALLLIDLDNFKAINDTFGHIHGDELLKQFSNRLKLLVRKGDLVSRVGGDEFTLISQSLKTASNARHLAERILNEINTPYTINGKLITVTVSIGISIFPVDGSTTEDLLRKADLAMYKSKDSGKNNYHFYTEQLGYLQHRESELESHLRIALHNDEFTLYFQPQYNLITSEVVGAEILLRWTNETLGTVSPGEFIPVAESTGLIVDLGQWVIKRSCEQIRQWIDKFNSKLTFSINISPIQLANNQFLRALEQTINDYDIPSGYIELEITENLLIGDNSEISKVLNSISDMGVRLSLDDFGIEYSSLNRLNSLPIDCLKIDKSFIADIQNDHEKVVIIDIIIKLAQELGMRIIAEGIETLQQLKYLVSKKCHYGQGFLFSKPLPHEEFVKLVYESKKLTEVSNKD